MPDASNLVTNTALDIEIQIVEKKYQLFTNSTLNTKIESAEKKIPNHGKLTAESFAERLKQVKLATTNDLNAVKIHAVENEEKTGKLQTFDSSYFLGKFFFR